MESAYVNVPTIVPVRGDRKPFGFR
jgi:hypothetical protein